jgi:hypothetical protein
MTIKVGLESSQSKHSKVRNSSLCIGHPDEDGGERFAGTTLIETMKLEPGPAFKSRFCALTYVPTLEDGRLPAVKHVILLVIHEADCILRFLVNPNLKTIVGAIDLPHIESLLKDFVELINLHAAQLFRQLCSLAVGPLQAESVGEDLYEHPELHELALQFAPL